jgi:hypothetical protein
MRRSIDWMREVAIVTSVKGKRSVSHHSPRQRAAGARWSRHTSSTDRPASIRSSTIRSAISVLSSHSAVARAVAIGDCMQAFASSDRSPRRLRARHGPWPLPPVPTIPATSRGSPMGHAHRDDATPRAVFAGILVLGHGRSSSVVCRMPARANPDAAFVCMPLYTEPVSIKIDISVFSRNAGQPRQTCDFR